MHSNHGSNNNPSWQEFPDLEENTDPGIDRMATQYVVDPDAPPPPGGYATPYVNTPSSPALPLHSHGRAGQAPQITPQITNPTGGFPQIQPGFIPSNQISGSFEQLSSAGMMSPGFTQPQQTGSFGQISSPGMISPGFTQPQQTGSFGQISSPGMMSPGFTQPQQTGSFGQISNPGMMSPGFIQPSPPSQNPNYDPAHLARVRIRYALAAGATGAIAGALLGVLNSAMQGWEISQGMPQLLTLTVLFTAAFAAIAYFRQERVDELLEKGDLTTVTEFLNRPSKPKHAPHIPVIQPTGSFQQPTGSFQQPTGSFQQPTSGMYNQPPAAAFRTPDPDSTDEIPIR